MRKLYGISASRAMRPLWLLEELGLEFEHIPLDYRSTELRSPEYLAINPNGQVPTLIDGELVLWESMAINLYLASRYGRASGLWPDTPQGEGLTYQWSFWVMTEVELALLTLLFHRRLLPEVERDADKAARNEGILRRPFGILDAALADRAWLVAERFTLADLNVAAVLAWAKPAKLDLKGWPHLLRWLDACLARPALQRARAR